jgi:hypothetical protein
MKGEDIKGFSGGPVVLLDSKSDLPLGSIGLVARSGKVIDFVDSSILAKELNLLKSQPH